MRKFTDKGLEKIMLMEPVPAAVLGNQRQYDRLFECKDAVWKLRRSIPTLLVCPLLSTFLQVRDDKGFRELKKLRAFLSLERFPVRSDRYSPKLGRYAISTIGLNEMRRKFEKLLQLPTPELKEKPKEKTKEVKKINIVENDRRIVLQKPEIENKASDCPKKDGANAVDSQDNDPLMAVCVTIGKSSPFQVFWTVVLRDR